MRMLYSFLLLLLVTVHIQAIPKPLSVEIKHHPLVIVPGDGGCRVYTHEKNVYPAEASLTWLNWKSLFNLPGVTKRLALIYDAETHSTHDNEDFDVTFPGWGGTDTMEYLDLEKRSFAEYLFQMVDAIEEDPFYVSNRTIRGAPYDFRKAPNDNPEFVRHLKKLIEDTYAMNENARVVLVGHSLGSLYTLYFLQTQTDDWKKMYIQSYIPIGGPFGGAVRALKTILSGDNFGIFFHKSLSFRALQRGMPSIFLLFPNPQLWSKNEILVQTPKVNYSAHDYEKMFNDIGFPDGYQIYLDSMREFNPLASPTGIDHVLCVYGTEVETPIQLQYREPSFFFHKGFPDESPTLINDNGDGTVPIRSLEICANWTNVELLVLPGAGHTPAASDPRFLKVLRRILHSH